MSADEARLAAIRAVADWEGIADDLACLPVVWDDRIADVLGQDQGWRGATRGETDRIVQVVTAHLRGAAGPVVSPQEESREGDPGE